MRARETRARFKSARHVACLVCLYMLSIPVRAQAAKDPIGINPDYASPTPETPAGAKVDSASLVENANQWNGRIIAFTGEAIGERMVRGEMAWIHLNDDPYMEKRIEEGTGLKGYNSGHAIWVPADLTRRIRHFGDYKHQGDIVEVKGTFHAACREHGGDMDIHAASLEVPRAGRAVAQEVDLLRAAVAGALLLAAGLLLWFRGLASRRRI
jgi:hypothetical protein